MEIAVTLNETTTTNHNSSLEAFIHIILSHRNPVYMHVCEYVFCFTTSGIDGEAPLILNTRTEISSANETIVKVEREEFTPNEHLTLNFNIIPQISEVFSSTSSTEASIRIKFVVTTNKIYFNCPHFSFVRTI